MKGEVQKGFMRAALQRGMTGLMTFPKLLEEPQRLKQKQIKEIQDILQLASRKKIEAKLLVPVSPMSVATFAITTRIMIQQHQQGRLKGQSIMPQCLQQGHLGAGGRKFSRGCAREIMKKELSETRVYLYLSWNPHGLSHFPFLILGPK
jgi:hypothetical protein